MNPLERTADRLVVHPPRRASVQALAIGLIGLAVGVLLIVVGGTAGTVAGVLLAVLFGLTALGGLARVLRRRPVLTVTREGVEDTGSLVAAGFLPWSEVGSLDLLTARRGGELLVIGVRDPEAVLTRANPARARVARRQAGMLGSPVVFAPALLPVPARVLRDEIDALRPG